MTPERWQRIEQLYHQALERPALEGAAWLVSVCGDDTEVRREVELLLAANDQASGFLTAPALQLAAQSLAADERPTKPLGAAIGQQFSHYKILSRIGAGGMGEVFLARDASLERRVALKLLPVRFTQDPERLQRFIREAKAASALNHPNIITIYEIGVAASAHGQMHFIATEYIEGVTLREWEPEDEDKRLSRTLELGSQIASALDAAHHAGIIHRDINPENLMVRPDGLVKVLDFGLAKLTATTSSSDNQIDTDAQTTPAEMQTLPGMILGTLRYMSPEQARGRTLDTRTDIFSLGVVLYELLTRRPLFEGETTADVIAAILHQEPPRLSEYLPNVPPELERILRKALAKDCRDRYQDARDLQIDLQTLKQESELSARLARSGQAQAANSGAVAQPSSVTTAPRLTARRALFLVPAVLLFSVALWWLNARRDRTVDAPPPAALKHTEVVTWQSTAGEVESKGALSPDGKWVAFASAKSGSKNIWVRQTGSGEDHQSTRDEFRNENPIWSPAGDELAFFSTRGGQPGLWRMPPLGGQPTLLKTLTLGEGDTRLCSWSKDGTTIYYVSKLKLIALDVKTGQTTQLTSFDPAKDQIVGNSLNIAADGQSIVYIAIEANDHQSVWVRPVHGGSPKRIAEHSAETRNTVWHPDGERVLYSSRVDGALQIFVADVAGHQPVQLTFGERDSMVLGLTADGTKVLYSSAKEESDLWGVNTVKAEEFAVASDISAELWPDVAPNNQTVVYQAVKNLSQGDKLEHCEILTRTIAATNPPFILAKDGFLPKWSPDGEQLAFLRKEKLGYSLKAVNVVGGAEKSLVAGGVYPGNYNVLPYVRSEASDFSWAPDGKRLAYGSTKDGLRNIRLVNSDGTNDTPLTNNNDANLFVFCPLWSTDGKRLAYASRPNKIAKVEDNIVSFGVADLETKQAKALVQLNARIRLLGWSQTGQELLFARFIRDRQVVSLWRLSVATGAQQAVAELPVADYYNIHLAPNRRALAYVSHQDGMDNVWLLPVAGGVARKLTANNDPRLYISSLAWSPDSRALYYGKQSRYSLLSMITNFR